MSKRSALWVAVAAGFSLWGCSDEKAGPGVGPETSWRLRCGDDPEMVCGTDESGHGPLDGRDADDKNDDYKFEVSCSRKGSGLEIRIEDPGRERNVDRQQEKRPRSILSITRADPEENECVVSVTEYPNSGTPKMFKVTDSCAGGSEAGTCQLEGEFGSNGYAFEGTLRCDGMKYNGVGPGAWTLGAADASNDPVVLQIANCD